MFEMEVQARILAETRCVPVLGGMLRKRDVLKKLKIKIYKTVVRPVLMRFRS